MDDATVHTIPGRNQPRHSLPALAEAYRREAGRTEVFFAAWQKCRGPLKDHLGSLYSAHSDAADRLFDAILAADPQDEHDVAIVLDAIIAATDRDWDNDDYLAQRNRLVKAMRRVLIGNRFAAGTLAPAADGTELGAAFENWLATQPEPAPEFDAAA